VPRLLRFIDENRWGFAEELDAWIEKGDLPAAPFGDFRASPTNKLSVWVVEDDGQNLARIIAGVAAKRGKIADKLDALLFESAILDRLGIRSNRSPGDSKRLYHRQAESPTNNGEYIRAFLKSENEGQGLGGVSIKQPAGMSMIFKSLTV